MNKLYTIQVNVPICPECGGGLKFYQIGNRYRCFHCGDLWNVVGFGQSEREFICERGRNEQVQNTINKE